MQRIIYYCKKFPRVFAAIWFMGAAVIPIAAILLYISYVAPNFKLFVSAYYSSDKAFFSFFTIIPLFSAAIWGFLLGGRLFDKIRTKDRFVAGIIGFEIALYSLLTLLGIYVSWVIFGIALKNPEWEWDVARIVFNFLVTLIFIPLWWIFLLFFGVIIFGWVVAPFGIIAALILYKMSDGIRE